MNSLREQLLHDLLQENSEWKSFEYICRRCEQAQHPHAANTGRESGPVFAAYVC